MTTRKRSMIPMPERIKQASREHSNHAVRAAGWCIECKQRPCECDHVEPHGYARPEVNR